MSRSSLSAFAIFHSAENLSAVITKFALAFFFIHASNVAHDATHMLLCVNLRRDEGSFMNRVLHVPYGSVATSGYQPLDGLLWGLTWSQPLTMHTDNPFKWRQFEPKLILLCVLWYLRYALSYRDLEEITRERGLSVDHTTIYRWVQRFAPEIDKRCRPYLRRTNDSYRIDETYLRVGGAWKYLYRGIDSKGDTLDFLPRSKRDKPAAIAFFRKTLGASHTKPPRLMNVDKNPAYPDALDTVKQAGLVRPNSYLRQCKYLNNVIEQDHRFIKHRTRPMLGFKWFHTAWRTLRGIEMINALRKGQARWVAKRDVVGQTRLIHQVFKIAV